MNLDEMRERRKRINERMVERDAFFEEFGALDDHAYEDGAIDNKHKELMGLAISISMRCDECVLYHLDGCYRESAQRPEIVEAIKIGVMAGSSVSLPTARFAFAAMQDQ